MSDEINENSNDKNEKHRDDNNFRSEKQKAASRANGGRGRGPLDCSKSRWSALKHGQYAKLNLLEEGQHLPDYEHFAGLLSELHKFHDLSDPVSALAAEIFVNDCWRLTLLNRIEYLESNRLVDGEVAQTADFTFRAASSLRRHCWRGIDYLKNTRLRRRAGDESIPADDTVMGRSDGEVANGSSKDSAIPNDVQKQNENEEK